jgi:hypothetical protein
VAANKRREAKIVATDRTRRSGWITFAGVAALIAGAYNALSGVAALSDDDTVAARAQECSTASISPVGAGSG